MGRRGVRYALVGFRVLICVSCTFSAWNYLALLIRVTICVFCWFMLKIFWKMLSLSVSASGRIFCRTWSCVIDFARVPIILEIGIQMDAMRNFCVNLIQRRFWNSDLYYFLYKIYLIYLLLARLIISKKLSFTLETNPKTMWVWNSLQDELGIESPILCSCY